ncbi:glycoside hydrolase family 43 protein [Bifidobacterium eulemuris]|uniref:Beta-xylosidase n=1 Tax=Bifidobacterium eulemuris TaxID=1765219 RepID=A0A261G0G3_9BIFI|nr:glycoside hydrolase family 43 protein [Bifidobacterium eulemuris]OZG64735.1 beta-xylosidase [Bifidobacterium eulemuris]QOL32480.1 glycoside hydrolase family 43 protein [Bifidobacterium eulemuris]
MTFTTTLIARARRAAAGILTAILLVGTIAGCSTASSTTGEAAGESSSETESIKRGESHDPSIVKADGTYYIFGSHRAWLKSDDMVNWTAFENNLSTDYESILGDIWTEWAKQSTNPDITGNMWAPDVVWNETMGKWCMYMSVNGDNYRSVIVLLTADDIEGDWTYVGPVVYSGFEKVNAAKTDVWQVLGEGADLTRYASQTDTGINAIDPCVKTDENGDMWMTFGSWFGGMWMFKLDPATGLRDYTTTYETVENQSDAYYGVKLAGGFGNSGEGSYLIKIGDYWYLFASYGNLQQTGGYQIRIFRSDKITGPYVDESGNTAVSTRAVGNNWQSEIGIRLMSSIQWSGNDNANIEVAQGHNSVLVDDDGTAWLVYHTRFSGRGEEHEVRVRQLMSTSDGWLVAAPYEYTGTKADEAGYDAADLAGDYELVTNEQNTSFKGPKKVTDKDSTDYRGVNKPINITLNADGTVSGDQTGTWEATDGSNQVTLTLGDVVYTGDFAKLPRDVDGKEVMTFTALGDNITIWASQL